MDQRSKYFTGHKRTFMFGKNILTTTAESKVPLLNGVI
jgi:hypothetical protein